MDDKTGDIVARLEIGFPANGRTINARELEKILFDFLPDCVEKSLYYRTCDKKRVRGAIDLAEDQEYIRGQLATARGSNTPPLGANLLKRS